METPVTLSEIAGLATPIPDTALVTDTAGVNIPSAIVRLSGRNEYSKGLYMKVANP